MKKTLRTLMMGMMALLGCTALTSCTNDDEPQVAQQEGKKGYVEFTLSRGADTRAMWSLPSLAEQIPALLMQPMTKVA